MNPGLHTATDKAESARGRNRRNARRQARRRRERLLQGLAKLGGADGVERGLVSAQESLMLLSGHLNGARAIATRLTRTLRLAEDRSELAKTTQRPSVLEVVERPRRTLLGCNRSAITPGLLEKTGPKGEPGSLVEAVAQAAELAASAAPAAVILDYFVGATALPGLMAAELLHERGIIWAPPLDSFVHAVTAARRFWDELAAGEATYHAGVGAGEFTAAAGRWGCFAHAGLVALLPGLYLPRKLRRHGYLVNLVQGPGGLCLDLYSAPKRVPLTRHPF